MARKIQILPESVTQAIAAGEVVERPASIVKELMENAIDAGSSEVIVELKMGGLQLIRVIDNGEGIDREEVPQAFERYATSKIEKEDDLFAIHTLGFRGEALPSIISVSRTVMKTRTSGALSGTKAVCEGGEVKEVGETGCPVGTEVEIRDLFYNLPVKRKFLKSIRSELRGCLHPFLRLSLSYPEVSFRLIHDGRLLYEFPRTESHSVRVEAILGKEIFDHLRPIAYEEAGIRLSGFVSLPTLSKGNSDGIYLYVNRRSVKDRMVLKAVMEAYRHVIPANRYPVVVLMMDLPPSSIDVNVHPTKAEVKFRDQDRVFHAVVETLRLYQKQPSSVEKTVPETRKIPVSFQMSFQADPPSDSHRWNQKEAPWVVRETALSPEWEVDKKIPYRILGQVQGTYVLCEGERELIIIDQHAAHERILFEKLKGDYENRSIPSEKLLMPILIELSVEDSFLLGSLREALEVLGFDIEAMGERLFALRSVPSIVGQRDPKSVVRAILEELSHLKKEERGVEVIHPILISLACHTAIRANAVLRREEMEGLVAQLFPFDRSTTCPHGRPIFFILPQEELAKQFKRKR
jgi:DNA mismatch repair protein MutL